MKITKFFALLCAAAVAFVGCSKNTEPTPEVPNTSGKLVLKADKTAVSLGETVTFTVELYINDTQIDVDKATDGVQGYNHTAKVKFAPAAGRAYDIKAVINPENIDPQHKQEPIEFTVNTLPGWGTTNDVEADGDYDPTPEQTN
jgi:hypothetical protein